MVEIPLPDADLLRLSAIITDAMGLHFAPARWTDMWRGIVASADALGFAQDAGACAQWLLARPALEGRDIAILAAHLTIGETYFLREPAHFRLLAQRVVPELMQRRERQGMPRTLRLWSAACCTGEEAYSIALWLHRHVPALADWQVEVLGSDLNPEFLRQARAGIFGKWSFRDAPSWLLQDYFRPTADGRHEILPHIARRVHFGPGNLAQDPPEGPRMDVIFCRNVLMYFTPEQARQALGRLCQTQPDDGWLIVGSSEFMHVSESPYVMERIEGTSVYRKGPRVALPPAAATPIACAAAPASAPTKVSPMVRRPAALASAGEPPEVRELADRGQWSRALVQCDTLLRHDKSNPAHHYLRGMIMREQGHADAAAQSFARALYLDPAFIMAHVAAGYLDRDMGRTRAARRHFEQAAELLSLMEAGAIVPESEAMTAAECLDLIRATGRAEVPA